MSTETDGTGTTQKIASVDMRYVGQNYELPVLISASANVPVLPATDDLREGFFDAHLHSYGYVDREAAVEVMNVRLKAVSPRAQASGRPDSPQGVAEPEATQDVWFTADAPLPTPVYDRTTLPAGFSFTGPAIITQFDATTVVPPEANLHVDEALNLILELHDV